ncbi:hypothetical protein Tco_1264840 [Tanacetum coccineum]
MAFTRSAALREAESNKEIFTYVAWIRAFNINEPIYAELCHEFYSTYEFDEVCADDELKTKKIIKFRLGGRAHSLTLLEFAYRLGLYHVDDLEEDGFNVYFEGGLRSDEHFNAQEYWLSISREENLGLSRSHTSTIRSPILRVIYKMITYGLCQRTTGYDKIQKNDLWLLSMFDARHQNGYANVAWLIARVLTKDVVRSLSAPIYCRDLDTTPLRDLIDSEGNLILEDPQPGVLRVGIPRPPRASVQDLYDRMEIRQEAIEWMEPTTHLVMLSRSMTSIITSTHLHHSIHHSISSSSRMMMKVDDDERGKVYNWKTAMYGKIWYDEDVHDLRPVEIEFPAIVFNDALTSKVALSCKPTVSPLNNNQIDFIISFGESDDENYTVIYDKNSFSYKIIYVNDLKTDSKNDTDKVNMPSFPSSEPTDSYFDDLNYFKDFEKEFPAIAYNDALTFKLDFSHEPTVSPQHIDEFNLKNETSLSECDGEEQNVIYFNDLFPFKVIYPDDLKSDEDNDDDKIDIKQSSRDMSVIPIPNVINTDVGAYAQGSNKLLKTSHDTINKIFTAEILSRN